MYALRRASAPPNEPGPPRPQVNFTATAIDPYELGLDLNELLVKNPAATFFFRAEGDAMAGAGIRSGDLLVVDRSLTPRPGSVAVACVDGELVVRQIAGTGGRLCFAAADPACPPIPIREDLDAVIWGVVTASIHPFA